MKKLSIIVISLILVVPVFAQEIPSDQEIADMHDICNKPDHFVGIGTTSERPANAGQYKPEWKSCDAIDAEHARRDLAAKTKNADELKRLNSIIGRISK